MKNVFKSVLAAALCLLMMTGSTGAVGFSGFNGVLSLKASAEDVTDSSENLQGTIGTRLSWRIDISSKTLYVSCSGNMPTFESDPTPWQQYSDSIENIIVADGCKNISSRAFCNLHNVKYVSLPDGLLKINSYAFMDCNSLKDITIPDTVTYIGNCAFGYCYSLSCIAIPDSVTYIGWSAFEDCSGLLSVNIPDSVETVSSDAFQNCSGIKNVVIGKGIRYLDSYIFNGCSSLETVVVPINVEVISIGAFTNCKSLKSVTVLNKDCYFSEGAISVYTTIYGYPDSAADKFAEDNGILFVPVENHEHEYLSSCSEYCQICGEKREVSADLHTFGDVIITEPVTCTEDGIEKYVCQVCGESFVYDVPATGHTPAEPVRENEITGCAGSGSYDSVIYCSVCDEELSRETVTTDSDAHTPETIPAVAPTCTESGLTEGVKCSVCGAVITAQEVVPAKGHTPGETVKENVNEATCENAGSYDSVVYCTVCRSEVSRENVSVAPSHKLTDGYCEYCGNQYQIIKAESHMTAALRDDSSYSSFEFTPEETGSYYFWSHNDYDTYCELVDEKGSTISSDDDGGYGSNFLILHILEAGKTYYFRVRYLNASSRGSFEVFLSKEYNYKHKYSDVSAMRNPTCTSDGYIRYSCSYCSETDGVTIPATGHSFSEYTVIQEPTCTSYGERESVCTTCGSNVTQWIEPLEHIYGEWVTYREPSCSSEGGMYADCTSCGTRTYKSIDRLSHTDENDDGVCDICSASLTTENTASGRCGENAYWSLSSDGELKISGSGSLYVYLNEGTAACTYPGAGTVTATAETTSEASAATTHRVTVSEAASESCTAVCTTTCTATTTTRPASSGSVYTSESQNGSETYTSWRNYAYAIKSVVIEEGITYVPYEAFSGCSNLESVKLPYSLSSIASSAFYGCISLKEITIPENVESVGYNAFYGCSSLSSVNILAKNADYYYNSFYKCSKITEMYVGEGVETLPHIITLEKVQFAEGATSVPGYAFVNCAELTSVTLPDTVNYIGACAFYRCSSLKEIRLPMSLSTVEEDAFNYSGLTSLELPNTLKYIGQHAFANLGSVKELTIPEDVETIGFRAFANLGSLEKINFNAQNASVEYYYYSDVFANCGAYTDGISVIFGDQVRNIPAYLFEVGSDTACPKVVSVRLGKIVTKINECAFSGCAYLEKIELNDTLTEIGDCAFINCISLGNVEFPDSLTTVSSNAFCGCTEIDSIELNNVTSIGSYAFAETKAEAVTIPEGVEYIGDSAFGIDTLRTVIYNAEDCNAGYAFSYENNITTVCVGESVKKIGAYTFSRIDSLEKVYIPDTVIDINQYAFYECPNMTVVCKDGSYGNAYAVQNNIRYTLEGTDTAFTIKNGVMTSYDGTAKNVAVPADVTAIGNNAFSGSQVETVDLPYSVTKIYGGAFSDCSSLSYVVVPFTVTSIGDDAFSSDTTIYCYSGSYAEKFAKENGLESELITVQFTQACDIKVGKSVLIETNTNVPVAAGLPLTYKSSDSSVVSISDGSTLSGVSAGKAEITAFLADGTKVGACVITVADEHVHSYTESTVREATCTESGLKKFTCSCGDIRTEEIKAGHNFTEYTYNNDATTEKDGTETAVCDREGCNATDTRTKDGTKIDNPTKNAVLKASGGTVDYKTNVTINASSEGVPEGYFIAVYDGSREIARSTGSISLQVGTMTESKTYSVRIVDADGTTQKDGDGNYLAKNITITVNSNFFIKLISFFRGLFGFLPKKTICP